MIDCLIMISKILLDNTIIILIVTFYVMSLYIIDGILNSEFARRALVQCTDDIIESTIDAFVLIRKLYSKEVISENVYKIARDKKTRDSNEERLDMILDNLKDHVKHDASIFTSFVYILRGMGHNDLADVIIEKYKGMYNN